MMSHTARAKFLLFVILFFGTAAEIFAAAGDLDLSFGVDGIVSIDNGSGSESVIDLAVQPDGKIIAIGYSGEGSGSMQRIAIVRYTVNGNIDPTFGTNGRVFIPQRMPGRMALQPDGKIVFVSPFGASPFANFYVGRLNSDGSFDTTFNGTGTVNINLRGTDDEAYTVKIQPDGKILVGGISSRALSSSQDDNVLVRFNPNGSLDTNFDGDGKLFMTPPPTGQLEGFWEFTFQPDGKILQAGTLNSYNTSNQLTQQEFLVVRYNSDGSLDTTFDGDGKVVTRFDSPTAARTDARAAWVALQTDGKIVAVGTATFPNIPDSLIIAAARYNTDGSLDSTYGNGGKALISYSSTIRSRASDIAIQADNKIVIAGGSDNNNNLFNPTVARLNTDGSLDPSFSGDGWNVVTGPPNRASTANSIVIQPGGKIVIGGANNWYNDTDFMLLRFEGSTCTPNCPVPGRETIADFDGDGKTDLSVYRNGRWFINSSSANNPNSYSTTEFGYATASLTPADFDGDGKTDIAVWHPNYSNSNGAFLIIRSSTNTLRVAYFGQAGDDPRVVGDWDFDGRADVAVYRAAASAGAQSFFYYLPSSTPETYVTIPWGTVGDEAVRGDFDGDGRMDAAVFRPSNQVWYVLQSSNSQPRYEHWGFASDQRVAGDYDGDGRTDVAIYRNGLWAVIESSNNQPRYVNWGLSSDRAVAGDYDGDGKADFAVYRDGFWYLLRSQQGFAAAQFGLANDRPIPAAFVR